MTTKKSAKKKSTRKAAGKKASRRKPKHGPPTGFRTFAMHAAGTEGESAFSSLRAERKSYAAFALAETDSLSTLDPETVARQCLEQALASPAIPSFTNPQDGGVSEFKSLGTETVFLTNTKIVKFRQIYNKVPVYSSLVTVELDESNECLSINSALGTPAGVNPIAKVSPAEAVKNAFKVAGMKLPVDAVPRLHYYHDPKTSRWRLVYIIEDVPIDRAKRRRRTARKLDGPSLPFNVDYIIDAHTGSVIAELSRTHTMSAALEEVALDDLGRPRRIRFALRGTGKVLFDERLNLITHDFQFNDPVANEVNLPGSAVTNPPQPWLGGAISAHANAGVVASFLRDILRRNNIDNMGGPIISSINCVVARESPDGRQWFNAFWNRRRNQMVYGQAMQGTTLRSLAVSLDIVAHEMFHGVTDRTSRLQFEFQSGALDESYSDIFGVIISNISEPDIARWDFQLGEGLGSGGRALRDLSQPSRHGQPQHMNQFRVLPNTPSGDFGGVHINSGIHNFAAFKIMFSRDPQGRFLFSPVNLAAIFFIALTQQLTRQSNFSASRMGIELAALSLFRNEPAAVRDVRIAAIRRAFDEVGIRAP